MRLTQPGTVERSQACPLSGPSPKLACVARPGPSVVFCWAFVGLLAVFAGCQTGRRSPPGVASPTGGHQSWLFDSTTVPVPKPTSTASAAAAPAAVPTSGLYRQGTTQPAPPSQQSRQIGPLPSPGTPPPPSISPLNQGRSALDGGPTDPITGPTPGGNSSQLAARAEGNASEFQLPNRNPSQQSRRDIRTANFETSPLTPLKDTRSEPTVAQSTGPKDQAFQSSAPQSRVPSSQWVVPTAHSADEVLDEDDWYGYTSDYRELHGRLEYSPIQKRWKLRYVPTHGRTDRYGGSVILIETSQLQGLVEDQFVIATGRLRSHGDDPPEYLVETLRRRQP